MELPVKVWTWTTLSNGAWDIGFGLELFACIVKPSLWEAKQW